MSSFLGVIPRAKNAIPRIYLQDVNCSASEAICVKKKQFYSTMLAKKAVLIALKNQAVPYCHASKKAFTDCSSKANKQTKIKILYFLTQVTYRWVTINKGFLIT